MPTPAVLINAFVNGTAEKVGAEPIKLARPGRKPYHAVFVSPSKRESSSVTEAMAGLHSPDMAELESQTPGGKSGLGFWKDGAEESRMVPVGDPGEIPRTAAALGRRFDQKAVIGFNEDPAGTDKAHVLVVPGTDPEAIHRALMNHGVEYKTVLPLSATHSQVHILDGDGGVTPSVRSFAAATGSKLKSVPGFIHFVGADTREAAQKEYDRVLGSRPTPPPTAPAPTPKAGIDPVGL